ncbi:MULTISPECIES: SET domain-containing protein-lysine N-methyltransferase [Legionella]|uniref:SET domain-containing protein-lysine N-methyltransferase n=1 Tax=Legionella septentrionalis TaxID=2498109 RepID=A0A3S1CM41_9GAMM|nr:MULTISPECIES: SET domain-containing protein-lysine N-methyltransferase [Legionella]MCP0913490.1 SET domain-containing protein-lysine N-methyltransferase [Legionella sp. 27cVA30]RUQ89734.1 SET domain-containing protein-lysine N-methyltransferase [Legionella septentrionalis]RUQ99721.1 SET domain-containing protein-lysine N-methyltransferase [Legionella septentrionalis]RUR11085.1 SET domain-containing protein-lysine N-methyltransferase [Legionella septentrionalis]RUR15247.1 SET domain-containi
MHSKQKIETSQETLPAKRNKKVPEKYKEYQETLKKQRRTGKKIAEQEQTKSIELKVTAAVRGLAQQSLFADKAKETQPEGIKKQRKRIAISAEHKVMKQLDITNMDAKDYIHSPYDKPDLFKVKRVDVIDSFGLFAVEDLSPEKCIAEYTGKIFTPEEFQQFLDKNEKMDSNYAMEIGKKIIDAQVSGGFGRYINCSECQPNVEFRNFKDERVLIYTSQGIKKGEQLLVAYNVYNEQAAQHHKFLNPQDGHLSTAEFLQKHIKSYTLSVFPYHCTPLKKQQNVYETRIGQCVSQQKLLSAQSNLAKDEVNFPYLALNQNHEIIDAREIDMVNPLMLASFLGQVDNVNWLLEHGANMNAQQNHSGYYPLFFTLEGYKTAKQKDNYLKILNLLISKEANLAIYDKNEETFFHRAVQSLEAKDLEFILNACAKRTGATTWFQYVDKDNHDLVTRALANHEIEKVLVLLKFYPDYFQDNFEADDCEQSLIQEKFTEILGSLPLEKYRKFFKGLQNLEIEVEDYFSQSKILFKK